MLTALAFAHFSSELLLKEQMIIPVKKTLKTLVMSMQDWSILSKFAKRNPAKSSVFYWLFLGEVSPWNFPWNQPIFLRTCPWKSFKIWLFCTETREIGWFVCEFWLSPANIPRNRPIFLRNLTFFPRKSREIGQFFREFAPENPAKFFFFFREISEALLKCVLSLMSFLCGLQAKLSPF